MGGARLPARPFISRAAPALTLLSPPPNPDGVPGMREGGGRFLTRRREREPVFWGGHLSSKIPPPQVFARGSKDLDRCRPGVGEKGRYGCPDLLYLEGNLNAESGGGIGAPMVPLAYFCQKSLFDYRGETNEALFFGIK